MIGIPFSEFRGMRSLLLKKIKKASHAKVNLKRRHMLYRGLQYYKNA